MTSLQQHSDRALPAATRTLLLSGNDSKQKRQQLLDYFTQTWALYESLFDCLVDEQARFNKAISLRHPLIFYYGHTATFYVNKLMTGRYLDRRVDDHVEARWRSALMR